MSPLRRRKRRMSRARARRQELIQRERQEYGLKRTDLRPDEPPESVEPVEESVEPVEETIEAPEEAPAPSKSPPKKAPRKRREFQPPSRVAEQKRRRPSRRKRRRRRVPRPDFGGLRSASATGARATVRQASPGLRRLLGGLGRGLGWLLAWPLPLP